MSTIYRKYRPQTFADVSDQNHIATTLKNEIVMNTLAHAYLFSGPRGVGKTTSARLLAKAVNCTGRTKDSGEPCNTCSSCQEISNGRHIDVIEIDAASQTGVDNVRENIIENAQFKPTKAKYKVFIIDEVHMLSTSAFNALLKTLEEPPAHVIFILATTELHKLPTTVISRCQRFHFKKIAFEEMLKRLERICSDEGITVEKAVLERIVAKSDGGLRDAESLLGQVFSLHLKSITVQDIELILPTSNSSETAAFVEQVLQGNTTSALGTLHSSLDQGVNADQFMVATLEMLRALLVIQATGSTKQYIADYNDQVLSVLKNLSNTISATNLILVIEAAIKRRLEIKSIALPQLPVELFIIESALILSGTPIVRETSKATTTAQVTIEKKPPVAPMAANSPATTSSPAIQVPTSTPTLQTPVNTATIETPKSSTKPAAPATQALGPASTEPIKTTVGRIQEKWNDIIAKVDETTHALTFVLKMATLQNLSGNLLTLAVPYTFHKDKLDEVKSKKIVEQGIEAILGEKILITCIIVSASPAPDSSLNDVATAFGGQIVG